MCHGSFPLDSGAGAFAETTLSGEYFPGDTYTFWLSISDPDAMRWGFEITVLDDNGNSVGNLAPLDATTQVSVGGPFGRQYAKQTASGTFPGQAASATWTVQWEAPAVGTGTVHIYGMGNAANNDNMSSGDHIYSLDLVLEEGTTTATEAPALYAELQPNFPNPFNPKTTLSFNLKREASVELAIFDSRGRRIRTIHEGFTQAGSHRFVWDGRSEAGHQSASGIYLARLLGANGEDLDGSRKLVLTK
jgi:hypothetical protein